MTRPVSVPGRLFFPDDGKKDAMPRRVNPPDLKPTTAGIWGFESDILFVYLKERFIAS